MAPTPLLLLVTLSLLASVQATLIPFDSCNALTSYFRAAALKRVTAQGLPSTPRRRRAATLGPGPPPPPAAVPGTDFSETNVQVSGVDEPDIVKTDGTRVFVLRGNTFFVVTPSSKAKSGAVSAKLKLPLFAREILLDRRRVLVIASEFASFPRPLPRSPVSPVSRSIPFIPFGTPRTVIFQISVARRKPKLLATLRIDGTYISAREVSGVARIVTTFDPSPLIPFRLATNTKDAEVKKENEQTIRGTTLTSWLPRFELIKKGGATSTGFLPTCNRVYRPPVFTGFALLSVTTIKLAGSLHPHNTASITAEGRTIYSTAASLYVATTVYRFDFPSNAGIFARTFSTAFHKFQLRAFSASYVASGSVTGSVLNQFSLHEFRDTFFIATTLGAPWWPGRDQSVSKVSSFRVARSKRLLVKQDEVGNLGIGERIFAVRYVADTAYVVTFRQVDPLYIIRLADPSNLKVTGELKIPGFSSYLHFIKPGRILGVGQEATPEGRTTGAKVTLFDVSDVNKPIELSTWTQPGSSSNVQWDHRAFLFWAPESVAVLPVNTFLGKQRFIGSVILEISDQHIVERGRITQKKCCGEFARRPPILRNFILGKTNLWSLSNDQLQINSIESLDFQKRIRLKRAK